jgi:putative FmdB family regulatory protein
MPIYEYRCDSCAHIFDALQKMSDDPLQVCPSCNEKALKKLLSAPKFRLKGSGWYETDFKTGDKRNLAESGNSNSAGSSGKSSEAKKPENGKADSKKPAPAASKASSTD